MPVLQKARPNPLSNFFLAAERKKFESQCGFRHLIFLLGSTKRRGATGPDTKDNEVSKDGKYLYAVGSGAREVSIFRIGDDRLLREAGFLFSGPYVEVS